MSLIDDYFWQEEVRGGSVAKVVVLVVDTGPWDVIHEDFLHRLLKRSLFGLSIRILGFLDQPFKISLTPQARPLTQLLQRAIPLPPRPLLLPIVPTVLPRTRIVLEGGGLRNIVLRSLRDHILLLLNHGGQLKFLILLIYCGLITLRSSLLADFLLVLFCRQSARRLLVRINTVIENLHEVFHAFVHARSGSRSLFGGGASVGQSCVGSGRCWKGVCRRGCGF